MLTLRQLDQISSATRVCSELYPSICQSLNLPAVPQQQAPSELGSVTMWNADHLRMLLVAWHEMHKHISCMDECYVSIGQPEYVVGLADCPRLFIRTWCVASLSCSGIVA